jgi:Rrf2 family nitric oxide-sensitive transcriptional repressor
VRLTAFSDYCLRVLTYVAIKGERLSTIDEVSASYGISRNHLMKVVSRLGQLGYVRTVRGKGGGIALARRPEDINLGTLLRQTEQDFQVVECFRQDGGNCAITSACVLRIALRQALDAFLLVMDGYTLDDLLAPHRQLARLLHVEPGEAAALHGPP